MRYFKNGKEVFAYEIDGSQDDLIATAIEKEWVELPVWPLPTELTASEKTLADIAALEAKITDRRMREAVLGQDGGWLADINAQITELRGAL